MLAYLLDKSCQCSHRLHLDTLTVSSCLNDANRKKSTGKFCSVGWLVGQVESTKVWSLVGNAWRSLAHMYAKQPEIILLTYYTLKYIAMTFLDRSFCIIFDVTLKYVKASCCHIICVLLECNASYLTDRDAN